MNELTKYLDPKVLAKISRLELQARLVVEGFISGQHRSPFHGYSVEFASHREYTPGDDLRHLDWKVLGKTDRYYIKQYEEETNLKAAFLLDASESMHYRRDGGSMSKYEYAAAVTASLAHLLLQQQDSVGVAIFDQQVRQWVPPAASSAQLKTLVHAMHVNQPSAKTSLEGACQWLADKISRRWMVCVVSDLFGDLEGLIRGLQRLRHNDHEVMVLHIMDSDELEFPFQGNTQFVGLEEMGRLTIEPQALRQGYLEAVRNFCHEVKRRCIARRIDYKLISTAQHLDAALLAFLSARSAAARKAGSKR